MKKLNKDDVPVEVQEHLKNPLGVHCSNISTRISYSDQGAFTEIGMYITMEYNGKTIIGDNLMILCAKRLFTDDDDKGYELFIDKKENKDFIFEESPLFEGMDLAKGECRFTLPEVLILKHEEMEKSPWRQVSMTEIDATMDNFYLFIMVSMDTTSMRPYYHAVECDIKSGRATFKEVYCGCGSFENNPRINLMKNDDWYAYKLDEYLVKGVNERLGSDFYKRISSGLDKVECLKDNIDILGHGLLVDRMAFGDIETVVNESLTAKVTHTALFVCSEVFPYTDLIVSLMDTLDWLYSVIGILDNNNIQAFIKAKE